MGFETLAALQSTDRTGVFQGSIPTASVRQLAAIAKGWDVKDLFVGCSGTFKIERGLHPMFERVHGNDVTLYSCAIGWYMAGEDFRLEIKESAQERWGWLSEYLGSPADNLATILTATTMLQKAAGKRSDNAYFRALFAAYRQQFPTLHAQAKAKLPPQVLSTFYPGDVRDYMDMADPETSGLMTFPPFFSAGYEKMFDGLHQVFDWDVASYRMFNGDKDIPGVLAQAQSFKHWVVGSHMVIDELHENLRSVVRTRGWPIYLYSDSGATSTIGVPSVKVSPLLAKRLGPKDEIGDRMRLAVISSDQFNSLRFSIMNAHIVPSTPHLSLLVLVDDVVVGAFAIQWESVGTPLNMFTNKLPGPTCYLLSDFPIPGTQYPKLSKLILAAAVSEEARVLIERQASRRFRSIKTTAFSQHPVSMKYRGAFKLLTRKDAPKGAHHKHELIYGSELGRWTLAEALDEWKKKSAKKESNDHDVATA